ncbi:MAG TPA: hypothetical protein VH351_19690 [Bryobacteraceae bacterium]|nr:hypothetical protein [Bryobacteraceae bacterium]
MRYFKGSVGASAAALYILSSYGTGDDGFGDDHRGHDQTSIKWTITNIAAPIAEVHVLDA